MGADVDVHEILKRIKHLECSHAFKEHAIGGALYPSDRQHGQIITQGHKANKFI